MDLKPLIEPASIAIIGASTRKGTVGCEIVAMIRETGYQGQVFPINPKYSSIQGFPCYPSIESVGKPIDLTMLMVSANRLEKQVDSAILAGTRSMVIVANAVIESDGIPPLEERLRNKIQEAGIPVTGHNSMGFYNNDIKLRACGFRANMDTRPGHITFISQSGSVFGAIMHNDPQLRFNFAISTGKEINITVADYILHALELPTTRVIGIFLETIKDSENFRRALKRAAERRIPTVALKVGKSELGAKFTISHSGGLAGDDDAIDAVMRHHGVLRVTSMDELANLLLMFSYFPEVPDGSVALLADSGGERNLLVDEAANIELEFAELSDDTMVELAQLQDYGQEAANPLDPWGTGVDFEQTFGNSLKVMTNDDSVAIGIMSLDIRDESFMVTGCIEAMDIARKGTSKPLILMTNYTGVRRRKATAALNEMGVPVLCGSRATLKAIHHWLAFGDFQFTSRSRTGELNSLSGRSTEVIQEYEALQILNELGIPVVSSFPLESMDDISEIEQHMEYPVVLKTAQPGLVHKSDVGGVILNIADRNALKHAYQAIYDRIGPSAIVQPMIQFDIELFLGMKTDHMFGPLVIVGAGGIFTEFIKDKCVLLPQAGEEEIERNLRRLFIYPVLQGARGKPAFEMRLLIDTISRFCEIVCRVSDVVTEIDINPLAICASKPVALDAVIIRGKPPH